MTRKKRIGLALGGGGARGFAHLGVMRALKDAGIDIDVFSGTSMGAIIAVANQQRRSFDQSETSLRRFVTKYAKRFKDVDFISADEYRKRGILKRMCQTSAKVLKMLKLARRKYIEDGSLLREISREFIYPCNLEDLPKKVFVCAVDIVSGHGILISKGNAQNAIRAAISIAGSFPGVALGKRILVDGSAVFPVPIHAFMFDQVDFVLASDVGVKMTAGYHPASALDLLLRQYDMLYGHVASEVAHCSDYVITPDLGTIHWTDFGKLESILQRGYEAGREAAPEILSLLNSDQPTVPIFKRPWHCAGYTVAPVVEDRFPSV